MDYLFNPIELKESDFYFPILQMEEQRQRVVK